jgi:hypothetical protein
MNIQVSSQTNGLREANKIMADLKRLGIHDVELMWDRQIKMWAVMQVFKPSGNILLVGSRQYHDAKPNLMWWIKSPDGKFRLPSEQDLSDIIITVKRAQVWFDKGSDYMVDKIEAAEKDKYDKNRQAQSERIRSVAKPLKKAIRKELL